MGRGEHVGRNKQVRAGNSESAQVLKSNRMGTALCFLNPMEDKICKNEWKRIDISKSKRDVTHYLMQKNFLVTQFFEKGLNPCTAPRSRQSSKSNLHHGRRSVQSGLESMQTSERVASTPVAASPTSLVRSHTMGDLREHSFKQVSFADSGAVGPVHAARDTHQRKKGTKWDFSTFEQQGNNKSSDKLPLIPEPSVRTKSMLNIKLTGGQSTFKAGQLPPLPESDSSRDNDSDVGASSAPLVVSKQERRDIEYLRTHPDDLFPKMKSLLQRGPAPDMFGTSSATSSRPGTQELMDDSTEHDGRKKDCPASAKGDSVSQKYIRLIQKLTAFLPPHVIDTAKQQIREMSHSDAIYEHKERLLQETKAQNERGKLLGDDRWRFLESNLSPTHGLGAPWRRLYENRWTQGDPKLSQ